MVVGARQRFQLFRQIAWFLGNNRALSKFRNQILRSLISIIKSLKNLSVKTNINHVSYLKQENDPPLQLNTEECTFHLSFYIFLGPLTCSRLKISIALRAWVEKISGLLKQKVAGKKYWATFYFYLFWVHVLLLKVLLYLSIIFWKIRTDILYEENGPRKIRPEGIPIRKIPIHQSPPWKPSPIKLLPRKFSPGIFPSISSFVFLHLTLRLDNFSKTWRFRHFGNIELQNSLLSNINDDGSNIEKKK